VSHVATVLDPIGDDRWRVFIGRSADATAFHHPAWLRLLRDQYGYGMSAVCIEDEHGEIVGGLPLARVRSVLTGTRLSALPFSDTCSLLLARGAAPSTADALIDALREEQVRHDLKLEVRDWLPHLGGGPGERFYHHVLELDSDVEMVEAGFSKSQVKRGIKKALREEVTIERAISRAALDEFYGLHVQTRRRQGVPTQARRFIRRFETLFEEGLGFVLVARWQGEAIAAAVFLVFNGNLLYKYGASRPEHLPKRPNNLLFMEAIRWGCENGMRQLDFGRTDIDNEGLRTFKRAWGAEERVLTYTRLPVRPGRSAVPAASAPLSFVIRRSPALVGQLVGTALYRHVG
jgi:CelD/BcsL family acetyltransferase involved in cellulose biosynthesis